VVVGVFVQPERGGLGSLDSRCPIGRGLRWLLPDLWPWSIAHLTKAGPAIHVRVCLLRGRLLLNEHLA